MKTKKRKHIFSPTERFLEWTKQELVIIKPSPSLVFSTNSQDTYSVEDFRCEFKKLLDEYSPTSASSTESRPSWIHADPRTTYTVHDFKRQIEKVGENPFRERLSKIENLIFYYREDHDADVIPVEVSDYYIGDYLVLNYNKVLINKVNTKVLIIGSNRKVIHFSQLDPNSAYVLTDDALFKYKCVPKISDLGIRIIFNHDGSVSVENATETNMSKPINRASFNRGIDTARGGILSKIMYRAL